MLDVDLKLAARVGKKAGEKDIALLGQPVEQFPPAGSLDVDSDALLAPIGLLPHEVEAALRYETGGDESALWIAGLRVLVDRSGRELRARAESTPLLVGAPGSKLELVLNGLYFDPRPPEPLSYGEAARIDSSGLALAIPLHTRFTARGKRIVGTTLNYFDLPKRLRKND